MSVSRGKRFLALKVVKSEPDYTESALDEIRMLKSISVSVSVGIKKKKSPWRSVLYINNNN